MTESAEITGSGSDRRGFMKGAAVTAAAVGAGALAPGAAQAAEAERIAALQPAFPFPLPPVGVDIPCSCYASNVPLQINTGVVNLDFKGGIDICVRTSSETGLVLEIIGHKVVADTPTQTVTIEQSDATITPLSALQMNPGNPTAVPPVPPFPEMLLKLLFKLTVAPKDGSPPLVLSTDPNNPATLSSGILKAFPPSNQGYTLGSNVPLLDSNGNQAGMLQGFPVTVNQSA